MSIKSNPNATLEMGRALFAEINAKRDPREIVATRNLRAALETVLPKVCKDVQPPTTSGYGGATIARDGNVKDIFFNIFLKGQEERWSTAWVGDLTFTRQKDGMYKVTFLSTDYEHGGEELFEVGQPVLVRSLDAAALHGPLTRFFAHGNGVREAIREERSLSAYQF